MDDYGIMKTAADIYRFTVDPESDTAAANVLRFVGKGKTVIELGAGPGSITRPMVELNGCNVSALEIDENSVGILQAFCEHVWRRDLNDSAWEKDIPHAAYDAVVIADVLEHVNDPWSMLRRAASFVNEGGSVVVSIPHASHASILACLLTNDFSYGDWGLLDRTHIRFFSMKNIQALFDSAGLIIVEFAFVLRHPTETEFADAWAALPPRTRAVLESGDYANVYQVVIRAVPAGRPGMLPARPLLDRPAPPISKLRYIAFYLPQFHPIPENDRWWGPGFTEWTNVTKAKPLFQGHYQPHLPADLGFYDLRVRETQHQQIALARAYGIDAFCFHYYWFGGKRLLERPVLDFLADSEADMDFCLCWANENWTRKWDASEHEILMAQTYSSEGDIAFIESMLPFFRDRRYLKVSGAPVLIVYRPQQMPNAKATAQRWRQHCRDAGIGEIHLVAALTHLNEDFEQFGYDAGLEFPPHNASTEGAGHLHNLAPALRADCPLEGAVWDYCDFAQSYLRRDYTLRRVYRGVSPSWDNTARVDARAFVMLGATPANYERWLEAASHLTVLERLPTERLVFINAWNEWAEGCHLEPDREHGRAFLEATQRVKSGRSTMSMEWEKPVLREAPSANDVLTTEEVAPSERLVERTARTLSRYPSLYRTARSVYRATLKRPESRR
jgi:2-polyprenyl-3-methyl-5-hydroxy-6-metoxy-1,4-benzoquinol methylase